MIKQHQLELFSKIFWHKHVDSILDFLLLNIRQSVTVNVACVVIYQNEKPKYQRSCGLFSQNEEVMTRIQTPQVLEELKSFGVEHILKAHFKKKVSIYLYLGTKGDGHSLDEEEQERLAELLKHIDKVILSSPIIQQLEMWPDLTLLENDLADHQSSQFQIYNECLLEDLEKERESLSAYLHDEILQDIIFINASLESYQSQLNEECTSCKKREIEKIKKTAKQLVRNIREKCFDLYPVMIEDIGFLETCEYHFTSEKLFMGQSSIKWICHTTKQEVGVLSIFEQKVIFRCLKELVVNSLKHARCTTILVKVETTEKGIIFSVIDDGQGFSLSYNPQLLNNNHFGLISVKKNIERIGGKIDIASTMESGTKVTLTFTY